jgi:hypothetical protein
MHNVDIYEPYLQSCFEICFDLVDYFVFYLIWVYIWAKLFSTSWTNLILSKNLNTP